MKWSRVLIWSIAVLALVLTKLGGWLDATQNGKMTFTLTSEHMWNDGMFLILFAILLSILL
jgi:hypothetical protein